MNVTIIGTGNMARGIGSRLVRGGHDVTVLGKETEDAEAVVSDIGAEGSAKAGRSGEPIADDVVVLAVYYRMRRRRSNSTGTRSRERS